MPLSMLSKRKWGKTTKLWLIAFPIVLVAFFTFVSYTEWGVYEELPFDLFYGGIFVAGIGIMLSFAVFGASVFRQSVLGTVWLLLAIGLALFAFADVWYYYLEIFEEFTDLHVVNPIWIASFLTLIYALYKHMKAI